MSLIENDGYIQGATNTINRTDRELVLEFTGKNLTTGSVDLYCVYMNFKDPITGLNKGDFLSGTFTEENVYDAKGVYTNDASTDQEIKDQNFTFAMKEDFNFLKSDYVYGTDKNIIISMLSGRAWKFGNDIIIPVGTNGVLKTAIKTKKSGFNKEWGYLFLNEWENVRIPNANDELTGDPLTKPNVYKKKIDAEQMTYAMEMAGSKGSEYYASLIPLVYTVECPYDEADNSNMLNVTASKRCDTFDRDDFMFNGVTGSFAIGDTDIREIAVDYIVENASAPTDFGVTGETCATVDPATGDVKIYTTDGLAWTQDVTGNFKIGCRIFSTKYTADTLANAVDEAHYIAIKTDSTNLAGVAANFADKDSAGTLQTSYVCKIFFWNRYEREFEAKTDL